MSDIKDTTYLDGIWFNYRGDNELVEKNLREPWPPRTTSAL
jgi:hypothetical protein